MLRQHAMRIGILGAALLLVLSSPAFAQTALEVVRSSSGVGTTQPIDAACVDQGNFGMRITKQDGDASAAFVEAGPSVGFNDETVFRASFRFKPADINIPHGRRFFLMAATPGTRQTGPIVGTNAPFRIAFFKNEFTGERKINFACKTNCSTPGTCKSVVTPKLNLGGDANANQWHTVQIEWAHNSAPGVFDATCRISLIDGPAAPQSQNSSVSFTNRQYSIRSVKMGMTGGTEIPATGLGKMCYDDFQSFRTLAP